MTVQFKRILETIRRFLLIVTGFQEDAVLEYNYAGEDINIFPAIRFSLRGIVKVYDCPDAYLFNVSVLVYDSGVSTTNVWNTLDKIFNSDRVVVTLSDSSQMLVTVENKDLIPIESDAPGIIHGGLSINLRIGDK